MDSLYITNARIVLPDKIVPSGTAVIRGKKIAALLRQRVVSRKTVIINARGNYLAPGFIDLHIHGEIGEISREQAKGGTTGFLATLHPEKPEALLDKISRVQQEHNSLPGARLLGIRLEGPFLNRAFCGALPPRLLRQPNINEARRIIRASRGALKMMIVAPELNGALGLIRLLRYKKIIASIGHTAATYEQAIKGIAAGASHATHTFNRMSSFDQRNPGALGAVLTEERVSCEVIADGVHVHPAALKLLLACKGLDKIMLVTDSTAAQKQPVKKRTGRAYRLKDGRLYGTALTLMAAVKNTIRFLGLSLPEAVRLVTLNPARVLKIDRQKGSIAAGKDADLVVFDKKFNVKLTMVEGKIVYHESTEKI